MRWRRPWICVLPCLLACGGTGSGSTSEAEHPGGAPLVDDPARARSFQAPLEMFVRPLDRGLEEIRTGATVAEAFGDMQVADPEGLLALGARVEQLGGARVEIGELDLLIRVIKDRGPPDDQTRYQEATVEATAVRAGGAFRLAALHSELRYGPNAPDAPAPEVVAPWAELRDALVESLAGPDCRFLPPLRDADLAGVYRDEDTRRLSAMAPDAPLVERVCADLWDRSPPHRALEVRALRLYVVDGSRHVVAVLSSGLSASRESITLAPVE